MKYNRNNSKKKYSHLKYQPINQKYYFFGGKIRTLDQKIIFVFSKKGRNRWPGIRLTFFFKKSTLG